MALIKLTLTEDHIRLISNFKFEVINKGQIQINRNCLYGGTFILEEIAMIIGKFDQAIEGTEDDSMGRAFPDELEEYMWSLHNYIVDNLENIESLLHQFAAEGIKPGTYKCKSQEMFWTKIK